MPPKGKAKAKGKAKRHSDRYVSKYSDVEAFDHNGTVVPNFPVWAYKAGPTAKDEAGDDLPVDADNNLLGCELFCKATVQQGSSKETFQLQAETGETFECPAAKVFNCNGNFDTYETLKVHDIGFLNYQNVPSVLDYMRRRYELIGIPDKEKWHRSDNPQGIKPQIYVLADPLSICVNPFQDVGTGNDEFMVKIRDWPDPDNLEPHTFSLTRQVLAQAYAVNFPQTIIVSGESGAGKTEAVKMAMRYCASNKKGRSDTTIQDAILGANPVLEAFGNAKTVRNNNSSRFGRYMQLEVLKAGGIMSGSVLNFLLEKSRVIRADSPAERNYHIFYQMFRGASDSQRKDWHLRAWNDYQYIKWSNCETTPGMDDLEEWTEGMKAYEAMKMSDEKRDGIYAILSGCLLLGEVEIESSEVGGSEGSKISNDKSRKELALAAEMFGVTGDDIEAILTTRVLTIAGTQTVAVNDARTALMLRDSLAKALFDEVFSYFVRELNKTIEPEGGFAGINYIGILDIFGFEVFEHNSLEQLFINVTNEALQQNFTEVVFKKESQLYATEGVSTADLVFSSNDEVIEMLKGKKLSVFSCLDDTCNAPGSDKDDVDRKLMSSIYSRVEAKFPEKLSRPRPKAAKKPGEISVGPESHFIVTHTIGDIMYCIDGFVYKNMDVMKPEFKIMLQNSNRVVPKELYEGEDVIVGGKKKLIAAQYLVQLELLMSQIMLTEPSFVRCIKPNDQKEKLKWVNSKVLVQLFSLSILEALQLKKIGYSYKRTFDIFVEQFKFVDPGVARSNADGLTKAKQLLASSGIKQELYAIGKTMLFMKLDGAKFMNRKQREKMAIWSPIVRCLAAMLARERKRQIYLPPVHRGLTKFQALARKKIERECEKSGQIQNVTPPPDPKSCGLGWYKIQRFETVG